jgi:uncharacterized protein (TIGR02452 family)
MSRTKRAHWGQETVAIVERGGYERPGGGWVDLSASMERTLAGTVLYRPAELDNLVARTISPLARRETQFAVVNETTLAAAGRLVEDRGHDSVLGLNFASAKNPGGGFLGGSQAQEESLARSSGLYATLQSRWGYYEANRACGTCLYTDHMILSPGVPVFRDDDGNLLDQPYHVGMLTAPAVNAGAIRENEPQRMPLVRPTMVSRIAKVLAVAAEHQFAHLVLGAWGCGVFRNDPAEVAELFADALLRDELFCGRFETVVFAVLDRTTNEQIIGPFRDQFGGKVYV